MDWADDLKVALEREIKKLDRQIKEARRAATAALRLDEKLAGQRQVRALEGQRNSKRRALFDAQDEIDRRREQLIWEIEGALIEGALSEGAPDVAGLITALRDADDHGLLGWCFIGTGQTMPPFSDLRQQQPDVWATCAAACRQV